MSHHLSTRECDNRMNISDYVLDIVARNIYYGNTFMRFTDKERVNPQALGQRIRQAREKQGLSQEQLAASLSVGQRAVSEIENGKQRLPVTDLPQMAQILQVPLLYFFTDDLSMDDLDLALLDHFHRLPDARTRHTVIEIVRLLTETMTS